MLRKLMLASVTVFCAGSLSAAPLGLEEIFGSFGAVAQSYSGNSKSEGRVIIQGDASGTIRVIDRSVGTAADGFADLTITGNATNANITVGNSGNLTVGGNLTNSNLQLNGGPQTATLGGTRSGGNFNKNEDTLIENATNPLIPEVDFAALQSESERLSLLSGANSIATNVSGQRVFGGSSVLNLDFSDLVSGTGVFDLTGTDTLIINVAGAAGDVSLNFADNLGIAKLDSAKAVIWNFFEATGIINFRSSVFGHVLAAGATINLDSSNEGTVIARSIFSNNGELHPLEFTGKIPQEDEQPGAVPLPAGVILLLTGIAGLAGVRRRRAA